jgi:hypothetical protein
MSLYAYKYLEKYQFAPDVYSGDLEAQQQEGRGVIHVNEYL